MRIGLGFDIHKIKKSPKGRIVLAGIKLNVPYSVLAHSDGDIVLHALSDAILSAMGQPDIGNKFPPGAVRTRNINSMQILEYALKEVKRRGAKMRSISLVLAAEKPKLGHLRGRMQQSLSSVSRVPEKRIGISFKTFEGLAPFAKGAIACWATVLINGN